MEGLRAYEVTWDDGTTEVIRATYAPEEIVERVNAQPAFTRRNADGNDRVMVSAKEL
jgi:hypothetical protein